MTQRKTKIVATLGPGSSTPDVLSRMVQGGLDVARLNCSHASHADLDYQLENVRRVSRLTRRPVGVLLDLCGPKVRTGTLEGETMELTEGQRLRVVPGEASGKDGWITCNHDGLAGDVTKGDRILLDDGLMELVVTGVAGDGSVDTEIVVGGTLKERKGMNLPDAVVSIPALTEKDKLDLAAGLRMGVDYVALSFVQTAQDIRDLKDVMARLKVSRPIIAKIEKPQALDNIDAILGEVDGIMVARGDLAVEVGNHRVPVMQKELLNKSNRAGVLDIVATQMLESMTANPRPTRAEASDVANAILDGCDAVMLSGETAVGKYPVESIAMMDRIACETEPWMQKHHSEELHIHGDAGHDITMAIVRAAAGMAHAERFKALIVYTLSGRTARLLSGHYPGAPILALTPKTGTERAMALYRGVTPVHMQFPGNSDLMLAEGERLLVERGFLEDGDEAIVVAGFTDLRGVANMVKVIRL
ncbi:MAG: pyruvate kinase [Proteobacteria bacterium]|nr:pyruvate kinase [Pseudomonadota bacterium]